MADAGNIPSDPRALTIRLKDKGPVGFVRAEVPLSLATLRTFMQEQGVPGTDVAPAGFRFLAGGIPVALPQEAVEDYQEGDVFIAALPASSPTAAASFAALAPHAAGGPRPSAQTLVSQWVDAFAFMSPDEQAEAVGVLCVRFPSASRLLGSVTSTPRRAQGAAASPQRTSSLKDSPRSKSPKEKGSSRPSSATKKPIGKNKPPQPPESTRIGGSGIAVASPRKSPGRERGNTQLPAWSPPSAAPLSSKSSSAAELRPAPLDERIARLYYGRGKDGKALIHTTSPRAAGAESLGSSKSPRSPRNKAEKRLHELHGAGTISSSIRSIEKPMIAHEVLGDRAVILGGSAGGSTTNLFASGLRRHGADSVDSLARAAEVFDAAVRDGDVHALAVADLLERNHGIMTSSTTGSIRRDSHGGLGGSSLGGSPPGRSDSPNRGHDSCAPSLHTLQDDDESGRGTPPPPFGSSRPQRPRASIMTSSHDVPAIGGHGEVMGVF